MICSVLLVGTDLRLTVLISIAIEAEVDKRSFSTEMSNSHGRRNIELNRTLNNASVALYGGSIDVLARVVPRMFHNHVDHAVFIVP